MSKKNILNLFLFIFVCSLASIIYFMKEEDYSLDRLSAIELTTIDTFSISHNNHLTRFNKIDDNHWQIIEPINIAANDFRIHSLLKIINAPVHSRYAIDEINLKEIGLDSSSTAIMFDDYTIRFGIINPTTKLRFLLFGDHVYTIEDVFYPLISSHFSTLVSLKLMSPDSSIEKLILPNQTIKKDENNLWQSNIDISADQVATILDNWKNTQAFGVHQYLERENLGDIFLYTDKRSQIINFLITDVEPWLIIARPDIGLEYHLEAEAYKQLIKPD
jgi:hypothetical protein